MVCVNYIASQLCNFTYWYYYKTKQNCFFVHSAFLCFSAWCRCSRT